MSRPGGRALGIFLAVGALVAAGLLYRLLFLVPGTLPPVSVPDALVKFRNVFTTRVAGGAIFEADLTRLRQAGFKTDEPGEEGRWIRWMRDEVPYLREPLPEPPVDRARALVSRFSRNGGGDCGAFDDLADLLKRIGEGDGHGCCSDHSEAFIALGLAVGLIAREVSNTRHVFNEFYVPEEQRWVWIDPQYALLAKDPGGRYLSLWEIREAYLRDAAVEFEFFGTSHHLLHGRDPRSLHYYDEREDFADLWMLWGSNVFEADAFYASLGLPRVVAQPLGLLIGRLPHHVMIRDAHSIQADAHVQQWYLGIGILVLVALGLFAGLAGCLRALAGRGRAARPHRVAAAVVPRER